MGIPCYVRSLMMMLKMMVLLVRVNSTEVEESMVWMAADEGGSPELRYIPVRLPTNYVFSLLEVNATTTVAQGAEADATDGQGINGNNNNNKNDDDKDDEYYSCSLDGNGNGDSFLIVEYNWHSSFETEFFSLRSLDSPSDFITNNSKFNGSSSLSGRPTEAAAAFQNSYSIWPNTTSQWIFRTKDDYDVLFRIVYKPTTAANEEMEEDEKPVLDFLVMAKVDTISTEGNPIKSFSTALFYPEKADKEGDGGNDDDGGDSIIQVVSIQGEWRMPRVSLTEAATTTTSSCNVLSLDIYLEKRRKPLPVSSHPLSLLLNPFCKVAEENNYDCEIKMDICADSIGCQLASQCVQSQLLMESNKTIMTDSMRDDMNLPLGTSLNVTNAFTSCSWSYASAAIADDDDAEKERETSIPRWEDWQTFHRALICQKNAQCSLPSSRIINDLEEGDILDQQQHTAKGKKVVLKTLPGIQQLVFNSTTIMYAHLGLQLGHRMCPFGIEISNLSLALEYTSSSIEMEGTSSVESTKDGIITALQQCLGMDMASIHLMIFITDNKNRDDNNNGGNNGNENLVIEIHYDDYIGPMFTFVSSTNTTSSVHFSYLTTYLPEVFYQIVD